MLNFRPESVDEVSGPVVLAHAVGTPVAGYDVGFMREYCGSADVLFEPTVGPVLALLALRDRLAVPKERAQNSAAVITRWEKAATQDLDVYREMGWI